MNKTRYEICERIRFLFKEARDQGADTDAWAKGPDAVDQICRFIDCNFADEALEYVDRARDPRWRTLYWYLQGVVDGAESCA